MKVILEGNEQVSSKKPLKIISYKIDNSATATALIAETLRKSYKYPINTLMQEYLSNARDVHRQKKIKKAIQVQVPTDLNPEMFVRDFGTGISPEEIGNYITFAYSTKRDNNDFTGGFGYGSKSAFAYANSFTIISYYKGIQYTYRASVAEQLEGALALISEVPTKEEDGLKIQIAVRPADRVKFLNAAIKFKTYWIDQEIELINVNPSEINFGKECVEEFDNIKCWKVNDSSQDELYNRGSNNRIFLLIDNIPYNLDNIDFNAKVANFHNNMRGDNQISISVPTGKIKVSKYREYIENDTKNSEVINDLIDKAIDNVKKHFGKKVFKKITNIKDIEFDQVLSSLMFTREVPVEIEIGSKSYKANIHYQGYNSHYSSLRLTIDKTEQLSFTNIYHVSFGSKVNKTELQYYSGPISISIYPHPDVFCYQDNTESSLFNCQRLTTICRGHSQLITLLVKDKLTNFEKNLLKFVNCQNLKDIERTIQVKTPKLTVDGEKVKKVQHFISFTEVSYNSSRDQIEKERGSLGEKSKTDFSKALFLIEGNKHYDFECVQVRALKNLGYRILMVNQSNYDKLIESKNTIDGEDALEKGNITVSKDIEESFNENLDTYIFSVLRDRPEKAKLEEFYKFYPEMLNAKEKEAWKFLVKQFELTYESAKLFQRPQSDMRNILDSKIIKDLKKHIANAEKRNAKYIEMFDFFKFLTIIDIDSWKKDDAKADFLKIVERMRK